MRKISIILLVCVVFKCIATIYYLVNQSRYCLILISMMEICGIIYCQTIG